MCMKGALLQGYVYTAAAVSLYHIHWRSDVPEFCSASMHIHSIICVITYKINRGVHVHDWGLSAGLCVYCSCSLLVPYPLEKWMCMSAWPCVPITACGNSATHVSHMYKATCVYVDINIYIYILMAYMSNITYIPEYAYMRLYMAI